MNYFACFVLNIYCPMPSFSITPAISRCIQLGQDVNSCRNAAAVHEPPPMHRILEINQISSNHLAVRYLSYLCFWFFLTETNRTNTFIAIIPISVTNNQLSVNVRQYKTIVIRCTKCPRILIANILIKWRRFLWHTVCSIVKISLLIHQEIGYLFLELSLHIIN